MANRVKKDRSAIRKAKKANRSYYTSKVEINNENIEYLNEQSIRLDVKKVAEQAVISDAKETKQTQKEEQQSLQALFETKKQLIQKLKKINQQARSVGNKLVEVKKLVDKDNKILDENGELILE